MSVTSIRIGLAGLGTAGRSLPQAVAKTTGFSFVAGADLRQAAREQYRAEFGIQTFDSVAAMCELKELDGVYVATPNPFHAEHAITALERGKHVMVEKPMALTLEDCDRMIAAAEKIASSSWLRIRAVLIRRFARCARLSAAISLDV